MLTQDEQEQLAYLRETLNAKDLFERFSPVEVEDMDSQIKELEALSRSPFQTPKTNSHKGTSALASEELSKFSKSLWAKLFQMSETQLSVVEENVRRFVEHKEIFIGKEVEWDLSWTTTNLATAPRVAEYVWDMYTRGKLPGYACMQVETGYGPWLFFPYVEAHTINLGRAGRKGAGRSSNKEEVFSAASDLAAALKKLRPMFNKGVFVPFPGT